MCGRGAPAPAGEMGEQTSGVECMFVKSLGVLASAVKILTLGQEVGQDFHLLRGPRFFQVESGVLPGGGYYVTLRYGPRFFALRWREDRQDYQSTSTGLPSPVPRPLQWTSTVLPSPVPRPSSLSTAHLASSTSHSNRSLHARLRASHHSSSSAAAVLNLLRPLPLQLALPLARQHGLQAAYPLACPHHRNTPPLHLRQEQPNRHPLVWLPMDVRKN